MMFAVLDLIPAPYAKVETTPQGLKDAWDDGKDFYILPNGPYCSVRDMNVFYAQGYISAYIHPSTNSKMSAESVYINFKEEYFSNA